MILNENFFILFSFFKKTKLRFLDTMCMHIACNGFTSEQRTIKMTMKDRDKDDSILVDNMIQNDKKQRQPVIIIYYYYVH
jgi:hypothetical protein